MYSNFSRSLTAVLKSEGGYVNNPRDPGGATNKGITQAVYDDWCVKGNRARQSVQFIHDDEVEAIYRAQYWNVIHGDDLPLGLDYVMFDYAVNSGPGRALRAYQSGASIDAICDYRLAFLKSLSTWAYFGKGWTNRVASVRALAKAMQTGNAPPSVIVPPQKPHYNPFGWLTSIFKPNFSGVKKMKLFPSASLVNISSIIMAASGLGAVLPKIITEFGTVGLIAAVAMTAGVLIQAFIPPATAISIENTLADTVIPAIVTFDPALKTSLDQVAEGLHAAVAASNANTNATANNTAAVVTKVG